MERDERQRRAGPRPDRDRGEPLDFHLLGCPVADYHTGEPLGRVRMVVLDDEGEKITGLKLDRGSTASRSAGTALGGSRSELAGSLGQVAYDGTGRPLGLVVDVATATAQGGLERAGLGRRSGTRTMWLVEPAPTPEAGLEVTVVDGEVEASDYMVGQVALRQVVDRDGMVVVEEGETITLATIDRARRVGMLHALEARFPV